MIDSVAGLLGGVESDMLVAGALFAGTAMLVALCVPGVTVAMSVSGAYLLGSWAAIPVVALGALAGSQVLFLAIRHCDAGRVRSRLGDKLHAFERRLACSGPWYVLGLRLCGAPHFLVTAACAVLPLRAGAFAAATAAGFLPAIAIAAAAGSAL